MHFSKVSEGKYLIRLKRGENINGSIKKFCQKEGIENAALTAIGSVENPTLAHYLVSTKKYSEKTLAGVFEVAAMTGNVGLHEDQPLVHNHIVVSDDTMRAFAGHLVEATASATLEIVLSKFDTSFTKTFDEEIGLKLYDLEEEY